MDIGCMLFHSLRGGESLFHYPLLKGPKPISIYNPTSQLYLRSRSSTCWFRASGLPIRYSQIHGVEEEDKQSRTNALLAQLCDEATPSSISCARAMVDKLKNEGKLDVLSSKELGQLAIAAAKRGFPVYGESIIRLMLKLGVSPHVKAWSTVIWQLGKSPQNSHLSFQLFHDICEHINTSLGKSAHMRPDTGAFNAILSICAMEGNMHKAEHFINQMVHFGVRSDVITCNLMIKLYGKARREDLLVSVVEKMVEENIEPCISSFYSLVEAYVGLGDLDKAEMIIKAMREGRRDIYNILGQSNGDTIKRLLLPRSCRPDHRIYTTLMKGYMQGGRFKDVVNMLRAMQDEDDPISRPNEVTYSTAISAFVKMGSMGEAHAILREMAANRVPANVIIYNSLLNGYCRKKEMQKAKILMQEMEEAGVVPDVITYNTLINGCISSHDYFGARAYFDEMRKAGVSPSKISYTTLIKAFGMNGQPNFAAKVFEEMQKDIQIVIDVVSWNTLIESYCKAGMMEHVKKVFRQMKEQGFNPTVATYGSLVNGFIRAQKPLEALGLWPEIRDRIRATSNEGGIESFIPDAGMFDSLVEICVRAAYFKRALEILAYMEELKIPVSKRKYKRLFVELHSTIYTSKHKSRARQEERAAKKQAAEAFKFWVGLPNDYHHIS